MVFTMSFPSTPSERILVSVLAMVCGEIANQSSGNEQDSGCLLLADQMRSPMDPPGCAGSRQDDILPENLGNILEESLEN